MPLNNPILSVLLSAYNSSRYVKQSIDSILNQTFSDFELLIADDGSSDATKAIIDSYSDSRIVKSHNLNNQGKVETVNRLALMAKGEYLTIHDADDFSEPKRFEIIMSFFKENSEMALVGSSFFEINGNKREAVKMPTDYNEIKAALPDRSQFHGPTIVFKKAILKDTNGLFRYFTWGEDIDFTARVVEKHKAVNIDLPLYNYRIHDKSLTKDVKVIKPDRLINQKLRVFLAEQRKRDGVDCLMENKPQILENERQRLLAMYSKEPGRVYWEHSHKMLYFNLKRIALKSAFKAFTIDPSWKNFKNLISVFSKVIIP